MPYAQLTGPETVKVYLSNFLVMDLLEWLVKSTQSQIHLHITLLVNSPTAYSKSATAN